MWRLSAFQNSLRNVGRQKRHLHDSPDISPMQSGLSSDRSLMGHLAPCDALDPVMGPDNCFN
jgi:hypothetical protein